MINAGRACTKHGRRLISDLDLNNTRGGHQHSDKDAVLRDLTWIQLLLAHGWIVASCAAVAARSARVSPIPVTDFLSVRGRVFGVVHIGTGHSMRGRVGSIPCLVGIDIVR